MCICVCVRICICTCTGMFVFVCFVHMCAVVCMCRQEDNFNFYSLDVLHLPWFETGSFNALVFAKWSKMAGQQTPGFCLYPSSQCWCHKTKSLHTAFFPPNGFWELNSGLTTWFLLSELSPQLYSFLPYLESASLLMSLKTGVIKRNVDTWLLHCRGLSAFKICNIICYK